MLLRDLGEWELLRRLAAYAPPGQLEDDAAILQPDSGTATAPLVVNTDVLVEGVHFSDTTMGPADLGWRAAAANLSDLAATGCGSVVGLTVGLVAPAETPWAWVAGVYEGLSLALRTYGGQLLGGDCSGGLQRMLAITALGRIGPGAIRRGDGQAGDWLVCTGPHGLSRLGLALLQQALAAEHADALSPGLRQRAIEAHRRPKPRLDAVKALARSQPPGSPWRVGGTDSSDGLAAAAAHLARGAGCIAELDHNNLPIDPELAALPQGERWCLAGGEDFELVLALEPTWAQALIETLPGCCQLGQLRPPTAAAAAGSLLWQGSNQPLEGSTGYSHF
ncbi:MAG: thiamine-phosphate kinase [Cyanobacteriota bacterium]